ncbi:magnesium/cobalt transporter CorA [Paroceanicella profunda]|uniref:Magnesium transport protein CorA n=1 Tax=Paroceanicella profunda TaxID=2579971 RepID=A0A5B8G276_9RHOB|nr:magnesium/cobalt transporter CorA [Paroceanicella profunda]QDL92693.1 magnesium/cobalt transporter CorA [Paroceanicella profunda]
MSSLRSRTRRRKRAPVGARPGILTADPQAEDSAASLISFDDDTASAPVPGTLEAIRAARAAGRRVWLDVTGLRDIAFIGAVGAEFGLHQLALEDVVNTGQHAKVESFEGNVYAVLRMFRPDRPFETEQISLFLGADFVLTFQERKGDCFGEVRRRLADPKAQMRRRGADYLAYALIDAVVDGHFPALERAGDLLADLEDEILAGPDPSQMLRLHEMRGRLMVVRRAMWPTRDMVNSLQRGDIPEMREETRVFLRDVHDHVVQIIDMNESYRETAASLLEVYLSMQNARMNEIIKILTVVSTVFIPLSFLAGLWGMNFQGSPWNMPELHWAYGYPMALGVMALVAGAILFFILRKGWLRDASRVPRAHPHGEETAKPH